MYLAHTRSQIEELLSFRHLEEHFLFSSRAQLFCREDHPILKEKDSLTMEKICQYNFALYPVEAGNARALESVYNNMDLNFINWNQIRQIVYVESRSALHTLLLRTDYLGVGILPILDQEKNYHIVSIPLPDSILSAEKGRSNYICSYIFPKGKELPKAARAYITFLEQCAMGRILIISARCPRPKKAWKKSSGWRKRIKPQGCRKKAGSQLPFCGSPFGSLFTASYLQALSALLPSFRILRLRPPWRLPSLHSKT